MEDKELLQLKSIEVTEHEEFYEFQTFPLLHSGDSLILSRNKSGTKPIAQGDDSSVRIPKAELEAMDYAYMFLKNGNKTGTPVRMITKPPDIRKVLLKEEGRIRLILGYSAAFAYPGDISVRISWGEEERREVLVSKPACEFDLSAFGIAYTEEQKFQVSVCFHTVDDNDTYVFGPRAAVDIILNPPAVKQMIRDENSVMIRLARNMDAALYAKIFRDGQEVFEAFECTCLEDGAYRLSTGTLNLSGEGYAVSVAYFTGNTFSYWTKPVPVLMKRPEVKSSVRIDGKLKVSLLEKGYYHWQEQYGYTDEIQMTDEKVPCVRYADCWKGVTSLGPQAVFPGAKESRGFYQIEGAYSYREKDQEGEGRYPLREIYTEHHNSTFIVRQEQQSWVLIVKKASGGQIRADFKELIASVATGYAQLEELSSYYFTVALKPQEMLPVRYGYTPENGCCDIHAGMALCCEYEQYQNIPELRAGFFGDEEPLSNRNLSGFTGNGSSLYQSILRDGAVTFEPFAYAAARAGRFRVETPQVQQTGRLSPGAGVFDTLFEQFRSPFVRLVYPALWKNSGHFYHGSMFYNDNICLISVGNYETLELATEHFLNGDPPVNEAAYVSFRGRTVVRIMIHIFIEGQPVQCPLGTTLGDVVSTYGLGWRIQLERQAGGHYAPFLSLEETLPLYIGDRICRS